MSSNKPTQDPVKLLAEVETINRDLKLQIQKRREAEVELLKFQRLYDTMVHNFPDGVIGVLNRQMEFVLIDGMDLNEIDLAELGFTSRKGEEARNSPLAQSTITKIKAAFEGQNVFFEVKTKDRFYSISAVPLPDAHNVINEILFVLKNVTEKIEMQYGLIQALEKEKELSELKSRFVTMACHEFKTPLATILSSTFLLEHYTDGEFEGQKLLHTNRIRRSVNSLTMILNEFLALDKLEEKNQKIIKTNVDLPKYIKELISELEPVKQKNQSFEYQHTGDLLTASLDQHMLWSIVHNLISNAIKYSGEADTIKITSEISEHLIHIKVQDFGIGIPEDEHKSIFGRFFRARNSINIEGTGLGLHIVDKNVKLFNGAISFTSQLNVGTEFTVTIPFEEPEVNSLII